jgi:lysophospholipase L1-like esterase
MTSGAQDSGRLNGKRAFMSTKSQRSAWLKRAIAVAGAVILTASLVTNYLQFRWAVEAYREMGELSLDPTGARRYGRANKGLPEPAAGEKRVVFYGDSRVGQWTKLPPAPSCQQVNRGVGGETTAQLLQRLDCDVLNLSPQVVVLQMGINDLKMFGVLPGREEEIIKACMANADLIVKRLRDHGVQVVVLTVFPVGTVPFSRRPIWSERTRDAVATMNRHLRQLSDAGVVVVDCDPVFLENGRMKGQYSQGMFHVNEAGYGALNDLLAPVLRRLAE